ncbi:MAG: phenylalanine--tRNA ligase subunit beta [Oscillospiraceae bacterium]
MNLPIKWLRVYTDITVDNREFSHRMTMSGSKVEGFESESDKLKNVVTGKVASIEHHPDSDHLWICQLDINSGENVQIVTGAQNLSVGDIVPVALDNSDLPNGMHIKAGKLRGEISNGMLCSLGELGLTKNDFPDCIEDGIMVLDTDTTLGIPVEKALGMDDTVFEFEITSNRPDCLCITGLAREAAITYGKDFVLPDPEISKTHGDIHAMLEVVNETPDNCLRYTGAVVENVRVKPSPQWMRERLRHCGVRPINNIVDITNYVMLEYNQPMHAFDYRNVKDGKIVVRQAHAGEKIITLDGGEHLLDDSMMIIADSEKPIAVAGVMGGEYSGISDETTTMVFESACFNGFNVRSTAKALGMRTEASARYEKGLDPNNTMPAIKRALELVEQLDAGDIVGGFIDAAGKMPVMPRIPLQPERICAFLGAEIETDFMIETLKKLGCTIDNDLIVTPPTFRADLEGFADLAEEVARFYGYDVIPTTIMRGIAEARPTERQRFEKAMINVCLGSGLYEINTYSFMSTKMLDMINLPTDSELRKCVVISNPLGEDTSIMRTTAVPSMLDVLARNYNGRIPSTKMFEIAVEFIPRFGEAQWSDLFSDCCVTEHPDTMPLLPSENRKLIIGGYASLDFYAVKGIVEKLLDVAGIKGAEYSVLSGNPTYHPGRTAEIKIADRTIGIVGEISPAVTGNFGIKERVYVADLDLDAIYELRGEPRRYKQLPKFPSTARDLALVCDLTLPSAQIEAIIRHGCGRILEAVKVFDIYTGDKVEKGKKSIAYNIVLRDSEKTLTDTDADDAIKRTLKELKANGIELRS